MWSVIWGQASTKMKSEVEATDDYKDILEKSNILALLKAIKIVSYKFDHHRHQETSLASAIEDLFAYRQGQQTIDDYHKEFKSRCEVIEQYGGSLGAHPTVITRLMNEKNKGASPTIATLTTTTLHEGLMDGSITYKEYHKVMERAVDSYMAALFLKHTNKRYEPLLTELHNQFTQDINNYAKTVDQAYNTLVKYSIPGVNNRERPRSGPSRENDQLAFVQTGSRDQNEFPDILCYNCQQQGHYASACTSDRVAATVASDTISALIIPNQNGPSDPPLLSGDPDLCF
jgi:hypothetical protein